MQRRARYVIASLFIGAGVLHFVVPDVYLQIMPPYLPWPRALVYVSGAAEVAGGVGMLLPPPVRQWAGYGLIALLLAVFPANVHMAHEAVAAQGWTAPWTVGTLVRLPLQFVMIAVVGWACRGAKPREAPAR